MKHSVQIMESQKNFVSLFYRHESLQVKNLIFADFKNGNNYWAELKNWRLQVQSIRFRLLVRNKFVGIIFEQYDDINFKIKTATPNLTKQAITILFSDTLLFWLLI